MNEHGGRNDVEENVFISLGSNLGEREENLRRADESVAGLGGTEITGRSVARTTAAVGVEDQPDFLNRVLRLRTALGPRELLEHLLAIENGMGRVRRLRWGPRIIDLDILFYGCRRVEEAGLDLPHPEVWNRPFFLEMTEEIDSRFLRQWPEWSGK